MESMQMHRKIATRWYSSSFATIVVVAVMLGSVVVAAAPAPVSFTSGNLLKNAGAESGMSGWTTTLGRPRAVTYGTHADMSSRTPGPSNRGSKFFSGGPSARSSFYQQVTLSSYAKQVAAKLLHVRLTGYIGGYQLNDDAAEVTLTFRGSRGQTLGCKYTLGPVGQWDRDQRTMTLFRDSGWHAVPVGTTSVRVTYSCQRRQGTECDGYAENLALTVRALKVVAANHMDCPAVTYPNNCTKGYLLNTALPSPSPQLTVSQINSLLKAHNDKRRAVSPGARTMPMLTWDQTLANYVYKYIQKCPGVKHTSNTARTNPNAFNWGYIGENIAAGTDTKKYGINGGANAVGIWNAQSRGYKYVGRPTCKITDRHVCGKCSISDCGHYTQVVWANSKTVGCAYAYCPNSMYKNYWICAYGPGGNWMGQMPYVSGKPKDACQLYSTLSEELHVADAAAEVQGQQRQLLGVNESLDDTESYESFESFLSFEDVQLPRSLLRDDDTDDDASAAEAPTNGVALVTVGCIAGVAMIVVAAAVYALRGRQQHAPMVSIDTLHIHAPTVVDVPRTDDEATATC